MHPRPKYRLRRRARFAFAVFLVLAVMLAGGLWASGFLDEYLYDAGIMDVPENPDPFDGTLNVLLLGADTRKGESLARADTIMLASLDTQKNIMSVLSIPRDTRVNIPGHGMDKINSVTVYGGPSMAMRVVSNLLGIPIHKYALVDYEGFKDIVDSLGGVTMDVKQRMYHYDPEDRGAYTIDIRPGVQRLDGDKALQFVRYRSYALGDIGRAEQQQKFLAAMVKEALQPSTVLRLPSLVMSTYRAVDTNLSLLEMKKLAVAAGKMNNTNLVTQTLPGKFLNMNGISYWEPDPYLTSQVVAGLFDGRTVSQVVMGETTINTQDPTKNKTASENNKPSGTDETDEIDFENTNPDDTTVVGGSTNTGGKKQGSGTSGRKTGSRPNQGGDQSSGGIVPPGGYETESPSDGTEPPVSVIIVPKTVVN